MNVTKQGNFTMNKNYTFDDIKTLIKPEFHPQFISNIEEIEQYRHQFFTMFDVNGLIFRHTVGFTFSIETPEDILVFTQMVKIFQPVCIYAGDLKIQRKLKKLGYRSLVYSFFEGGGFMPVLVQACEMNANKHQIEQV